MFANIFNEKKILITGNTGFKGSWLSTWLLDLGANVYGVAKDVPTDPSIFEQLSLGERITHYQEDIRDLKRLRAIVEDVKPDFLFHLAAQAIVSKSFDDPVETLSSNVMGTVNVLDVLRLLNNSCVTVLITSDKCYENVEWEWGYRENDRLGGHDIYSGSKGAAELAIKSYYQSFFKDSKNVRLASTRAGNVIGGGDWALDRIVPDCIRSWVRGEAVEIRSPKSTRPWQHVLEPLSGYLSLAESLSRNSKLSGESFNFGPRATRMHTVEQLIRSLGSYWNLDDLSKVYSISEEKTYKEAGLLALNCDKAMSLLGWFPTLEYDDIIALTGRWYHAFCSGEQDMYGYTLKQIKTYESTARDKGLPWTK